MENMEQIEKDKKYEFISYALFASEIKRISNVYAFLCANKKVFYTTTDKPLTIRNWRDRLNYFKMQMTEQTESKFDGALGNDAQKSQSEFNKSINNASSFKEVFQSYNKAFNNIEVVEQKEILNNFDKNMKLLQANVSEINFETKNKEDGCLNEVLFELPKKHINVVASVEREERNK